MAKNLKKPAKPSRIEALESAHTASRLLDEQYYADFAKAVTTKNQKLFEDTCKKAGIPDDLAQRIWTYLCGSGVQGALRAVPGPVW